MYDIDRALRRLELAHRLEELDRHRSGLPGPTPVPEVSAPMDVIDPDTPESTPETPADVPTAGRVPSTSRADVDPGTPRTLPNGLPLRTPGTRFRTPPPPAPSSIVVPLGTPLMPAPDKDLASRPPAYDPPSYARPATAWAADHDASAMRGAFTPRPGLASAGPARDAIAPDGGSLPAAAPRSAALQAGTEVPGDDADDAAASAAERIAAMLRDGRPGLLA